MLRNEGCRAISVRHVSTGDDFIDRRGIICLVQFLATKETLAPFANDPIMKKRSIQLFRHLECQNPSIISEDIGRARMVQQFRKNRGMDEQKNRTEWKNGTEYCCLRGYDRIWK